ncbi:MAG: hypothetical protein ACTSWV_01860 [Candidatus Asgardarchaeia archaeon]
MDVFRISMVEPKYPIRILWLILLPWKRIPKVEVKFVENYSHKSKEFLEIETFKY